MNLSAATLEETPIWTVQHVMLERRFRLSLGTGREEPLQREIAFNCSTETTLRLLLLLLLRVLFCMIMNIIIVILVKTVITFSSIARVLVLHLLTYGCHLLN